MNKKFFLLILVLGLTFALSGCATSSDSKVSYGQVDRDRSGSTLWIESAVRNFLTVNSEESYKRAKADKHLTDDLREQMYGNYYDQSNLPSYKSVSFGGIKFVYSSKSKYSTYIQATVSTGNQKEHVNIIVNVEDDKITSLGSY